MLTLAALDIEHRYERRAGENDGCPLGSKSKAFASFPQPLGRSPLNSAVHNFSIYIVSGFNVVGVGGGQLPYC